MPSHSFADVQDGHARGRSEVVAGSHPDKMLFKRCTWSADRQCHVEKQYLYSKLSIYFCLLF